MEAHAVNRSPSRVVIALLCSWIGVAAGCGDVGHDGPGDDAGVDAVPDGSGDATVDVADEETSSDATSEVGEDTAADADAADVALDADDVADGSGDEPLPPLPTQAPFAVPTDPLAGSAVESCGVYLEERCDGGRRQRCGVYDPGGEAFVADPDPLLRRALLFDRWRDLFNSPDGQAIDRDFEAATLPGTPEDEWSSLDNFRCYCGTGDGGIWTGWATVSAVLRYTQTGTEADYQRMEQQVRDLVTMYDVTGVPGYLSRFHYLLVPEGTPKTDAHITRYENAEVYGHHNRAVVNPDGVPNLPEAYTSGIVGEDGEVWRGTPMWQGRPSIDQNTGPMTALPMAYGLLRDDELKGRIAHHLTCYLKRLRRIELINLQSNQELLATLIAYFSSGELLLEEDDIDLTSLDRIVGYVHPQINTLNEDTLDWGCPESVQLEPSRVIDAASPTFLFDMLDLIQDMDTSDERPNQIDHYYFPSLRGGDAMHLMHLAAIAYHFTGDDQYRRFLYEDLIDDIDTLGVARTAGAFQLPAFCRSYFGDQITYGPWWAFIELLGDSPLKTEMMRSFYGELWSKHLNETANVDLAIMVAGAIPPEIATERERALELVRDLLPLMGGNGGALMGDPFDARWFDDPKRTYTLTAEQVLESAPDGVEPVCPTEQQAAACTAEISYAGITLPGVASASHACSEAESECPIAAEEGQCITWRTNRALPPPLRPATDFLWQRDPFQIGAGAHFEGWRQFGGNDYSEPYWNARRYGLVTEGAGQVLAWEDLGACE
ncbi:MAG: hypothetical protein H6698_06920 [Myxococcales bacterium]|nr:hypothetical protein [Myxococcales bacterium]MCB9531449.1 hypothetical protein [Myxococcales bacterium]MCB9534040.1 hypothetical protein [Myxococcales bacterium]